MAEEQNKFLDSRNLSNVTRDSKHEDPKKKKRGTRRHGRSHKDRGVSSSQGSTSAGHSTTSSAAVTPVYQTAACASPISPRETSPYSARDNLDLESTPATSSGRPIGSKKVRSTKTTHSQSGPGNSVSEGEESSSKREKQRSQAAREPGCPSVTRIAEGQTAPILQSSRKIWGSGFFKAFPIGKVGDGSSGAVASPPATKQWTATSLAKAVTPAATEGVATEVATSSVSKEDDAGETAQDVGSQRSQISEMHSGYFSASSTGSADAPVKKPAEQSSDHSRSSAGPIVKELAGAATPSSGSTVATTTTSRRSSKGLIPRPALEATAAKPETVVLEASDGRKPLQNLADSQHGAARIPDTVQAVAAGDRDPRVRAAVICAALSLFCVALVMIVMRIRHHRPAGDVGDPLCQTEDCVRHAFILDEVASKDVDPCDDFSAHVCSAWAPARIQTHRYTSAMDFAIYGWIQGFNETLHEGSAKISVGRKATLMYDTCAGDDSRYGNSASEFLLFLNETGLIWPFGPTPKEDALVLFVSLAFNYDASFWFSVAISDSPGSSGEWRVVLSLSYILHILVVRHRNVIESAAYAVTWTKILHSLSGNATGNFNELEINETQAIGDEILRQLYAASGDPSPKSALFAVSEFEKYTPSISPARWLNALQQALPVRPTMATEVYATHIGYLRAVNNLFAKLENEQLIRHLSWLFMKLYIPAAGPEFFIGVYGNAEVSKIYRPLFCGFHVEQPYRLLVSVLRFVSSASSNDRPLIDASFDGLVLAATEKLMNCYWLDARSKILAVEKVKGVRKRLWPEDVVFEPGFLDDIYRDFPENETRNFGSFWIASRKSIREAKKSKLYRSLTSNPIGSTEPYLTYDAILNRILMTMAAVAKPMYYRNGTRGMLYGGIGFLMALQLVKSLDRNGLRWHPNGSAVSSFLTEESQKEFAARDSCPVRDAEASVFPEIPAVEVAYAALQRALKQDGRRFRIARNLTEEKVFFMTLCFMTCPRRNLSNVTRDSKHEDPKKNKRGTRRHGRSHKDRGASSSQGSTSAGHSTTSSAAVTPVYQTAACATPKSSGEASPDSAKDNLDLDSTRATSTGRSSKKARSKKTTHSQSDPRRSIPDGELSSSKREKHRSQAAREHGGPSVTRIVGGETVPILQSSRKIWGSGLLKAFPIGKVGDGSSGAVASPPDTEQWTAMPSVKAVTPAATEGVVTEVATSSASKEDDAGEAAQDVGSQRLQISEMHSGHFSASSTGNADAPVKKPAEHSNDPSRSSVGPVVKELAGAATPSTSSIMATTMTSPCPSKGLIPRPALEATAAKPETPVREASDGRKLLQNLANGQHGAARIPDAAEAVAAAERDPRVRAAVISAGLSLFCVAVVRIAVQLWDHRPPGEVGDPMCRTEDCVRHAFILDEVASKDVDPCHDFSAYVCSAWSPARIQTHRYTSAIDFAVYSWIQGFNETLHEGSAKIAVGRKATLMYDTCTGDDSRYGNSADEFLLFLNETGLIWPFGPTPKEDALELFVSLAFNYDASFWFSVAISDSPGSSGEWRVVLSPSHILPILVVHHRNVIESAAYAVTWTKILHSFAGNATGNLNEVEINETRAIGDEILRQLYAASGDPSPKSALFAVSEFEEYTPFISPARWLNALQQALPVRPTMATEVYATHIGYLRAVNNLFAKLENEQLIRHLSWLFMKLYIPAAGPEFFIGVYGDAETSKIYRPLFCGINVEQPYRLLVSVLRFVSSASSNDRALIDASFDGLVLAATEKLMNCHWLDARSKILAVEKVKAVRKRLWPEDVVFEPGFLDDIYRDFPENETRNFGSYWIASRKSVREAKKSKVYRSLTSNPIGATEPYLMYDAILNRVLMTMAAVANPMYYGNGTRGMLYGGIGFLMALELVKSLDRNGLRWHPNGSAVSTWLTEESRKEFAARDSCRVRDADASVFPEVPAVEVAYAALQRALKQDGRRFRIARNLTEEKVFFMTLCFMTCPRRYTPSAYRVDCNKALQNFPEFATAFGCSAGSNMNPASKCRFFDSAAPPDRDN
ncbi:hypothetical protein HPB50_022686 [Hyalomma asiaticum]|uniref:Uncharacterized protein n=1 Tax=Hyalomma asiaticum TaxID=266040 RepID=A0ACB7T9Z8_HYAAI|nr:hypothetical protein HPB50_022686 [Hyalomma asiaticum]